MVDQQMQPQSEARREEIRRKVQRILLTRRVLRIAAWVLVALTVFFFFLNAYAIAIPAGIGGVALAILSDWVVKRPEEL